MGFHLPVSPLRILGVLVLIAGIAVGISFGPELAANEDASESITTNGTVAEERMWLNYTHTFDSDNWDGFQDSFRLTGYSADGSTTKFTRTFTWVENKSYAFTYTNSIQNRSESTYASFGNPQSYHNESGIPMNTYIRSSAPSYTHQQDVVSPERLTHYETSLTPNIPLVNSVDFQATESLVVNGVSVTRMKPVAISNSVQFTTQGVMGTSARPVLVTGYVDVTDSGEVVQSNLTYWLVSTNGVIKLTHTHSLKESLSISRPEWVSNTLNPAFAVVDENTLKVVNTDSEALPAGSEIMLDLGYMYPKTTLPTTIPSGETVYLHAVPDSDDRVSIRVTNKSTIDGVGSNTTNFTQKPVGGFITFTASGVQSEYVEHHASNHSDSNT